MDISCVYFPIIYIFQMLKWISNLLGWKLLDPSKLFVDQQLLNNFSPATTDILFVPGVIETMSTMAELSSCLTDTATPNVIYRGVYTLISYICNKDHNCHVIMAYAITKLVLLPANVGKSFMFTPNTFCAL